MTYREMRRRMGVLVLFVLAGVCGAVRGGGVTLYRGARRRFGLVGQVQIHHVIPREFEDHPALRSFDIHSRANLVFVPVHPDVLRATVRSDRICEHDGGHAAYNDHVRGLLDAGRRPDADMLSELKQGIRRGTVPWRYSWGLPGDPGHELMCQAKAD